MEYLNIADSLIDYDDDLFEDDDAWRYDLDDFALESGAIPAQPEEAEF